MSTRGKIVVVGGVGELGFEVVKAARRFAHGSLSDSVSGVIATYHKTQPTDSERRATEGTEWISLDCSRHNDACEILRSLEGVLAVIYCAVPKHNGANAKASSEMHAGIVDDVENVATVAVESGWRFVVLSTDLVHDGLLPAGQSYSELDPCSPTNAYGMSKAEMERRVLKLNGNVCVARTSLILTLADVPGLSGSEVRTKHGKGVKFVVDALEGKLAGQTGAFEMFTDELRCMSFSDDLAAALVHLSVPSCCHRGLLNLVAGEVANRYDLAVRLAKHFDMQEAIGQNVKAGLSAKSGLNRPLNCALKNEVLERLLEGTGVRLRGLSERLPAK